ncbi:MAG: site-specific integrase [Armatimonadetes bacterium]|nr:site-specific integrase [Armatimonadota bacterium]
MRGHIKKRGTWQFVVDLGAQPLQRCPACRKRYWGEHGRLRSCPKCHGPLEDRIERRQEFHTGYQTKKEAENELAQVLAAVASGLHIERSRMLLADYLRDEWLPAIRPTVRPTTFSSYETHVERHIIPKLGSLQLQQITGVQINLLYARLLCEPYDQGRLLSPSTVRRVHATLHRALKDAVRWSKIPRNPVDAADPPRAVGFDREMKVWTAKDLKAFLVAERDGDLYPLWLTMGTTGMRRGEALGLTWEDLDLEGGRLSIKKTRIMNGYETLLSTPKTKKGRRMLALDPATTAALKKLRAKQMAQSLRRGAPWDETQPVFATDDGVPYHPERVSKLFAKGAKKAGLPIIRLHDLRHTYATLALVSGIHPKVVSERLGHANIGITLDCYSHCLPSLSEEAASLVAALVVPD